MLWSSEVGSLQLFELVLAIVIYGNVQLSEKVDDVWFHFVFQIEVAQFEVGNFSQCLFGPLEEPVNCRVSNEAREVSAAVAQVVSCW